MSRAPTRDTEQKRAIRRVLEESGRPMSTTEVLAAARHTVPSLGIATVYRSLRRLQEENVLRRVDLPGEVSRYEVSTGRHHHHFTCGECRRVFEVQSCPGDLAHLAPPGFITERHEVILYGRCRECDSGRRVRGRGTGKRRGKDNRRR